LRHRATPDFWECYEALPQAIRRKADKAFSQLRRNPRHRSLRFKKVGTFWSARVDASYRALAVEDEGEIVWFWIGTHAAYEHLLS
jgi:hypothetical protein